MMVVTVMVVTVMIVSMPIAAVIRMPATAPIAVTCPDYTAGGRQQSERAKQKQDKFHASTVPHIERG
jgi:hypothetical protein